MEVDGLAYELAMGSEGKEGVRLTPPIDVVAREWDEPIGNIGIWDKEACGRPRNGPVKVILYC